MADTWKLTATLRSGVLLVGEDHEIRLHGHPHNDTMVCFRQPTRVAEATWPSWDHGIPFPMWDYAVSVQFPADDHKQAEAVAWPKLERIAAMLAFVGSAPVAIQSYGAITNAPEVPVKGTQYTTVALTFEQSWEGRHVPTITAEDIQHLPALLLGDTILKQGGERVHRSMRWLQHSHFASTPADEFLCLMVSFEAISHLLKEPKKRYWQCKSCGRDITECPECGSSTEWEGAGNLAMGDFVCEKLHWATKDWKSVWELRNVLFHGRHDLSAQQQQSIASYLPKLETAVIVALRDCLKLPQGAPPHSARPRRAFCGAKLHIRWTPNK